jgi:hypothetical protein
MKNNYINFIKPGTGSMNGLSGTFHPTMAALQKRRVFLSHHLDVGFVINSPDDICKKSHPV